jgi:hypothetical protein
VRHQNIGGIPNYSIDPWPFLIFTHKISSKRKRKNKNGVIFLGVLITHIFGQTFLWMVVTLVAS